MRTRVQRWGNSLALRIPRSVVEETGLTTGTTVDVEVADGKIVVVPRLVSARTLEDLLAQVTEENRHDSVDTGPAVGCEAW